ncbi:extracellular matrix regulator RemB [Siminovitchia sp. 179-K 8D1 HS]|uniref:extracellular matrix regulator RemB n=1 Tax=Siminovitchia sp. 179-K 8D1 HS TaxID=3142385 RepID=UPI0039A399F7
MYIHVGDDTLVRLGDIIAILDMQSIKESETMQELLERKKTNVVNIADESFKSLVITPNHMYLSPVAFATLKKKAMNDTIMNNVFGSF